MYCWTLVSPWSGDWERRWRGLVTFGIYKRPQFFDVIFREEKGHYYQNFTVLLLPSTLNMNLWLGRFVRALPVLLAFHKSLTYSLNCNKCLFQLNAKLCQPCQLSILVLNFAYSTKVCTKPEIISNLNLTSTLFTCWLNIKWPLLTLHLPSWNFPESM